MANKIPASDTLRTVAKEQESKLKAINEYKDSSEYSATHPNAISDGDNKGKGESQTIGSKTDIETRHKNTIINQYNDNNQYKSPE